MRLAPPFPIQSEITADQLGRLPGVTLLSGPPLISLCFQPLWQVSRRARAVRLGHYSRCHPYLQPVPLLISLFIGPSSKLIPGCRSSISFSRVWWEPCPPTGSGTLQLGCRGSASPSRLASAPRTNFPLSNLPGGTIPFFLLAWHRSFLSWDPVDTVLAVFCPPVFSSQPGHPLSITYDAPSSSTARCLLSQP